MDPENCACSSFTLALLKTKLHFGLLHLLDVFEIVSQLCQSLASVRSNVKCLDATPFSFPSSRPLLPSISQKKLVDPVRQFRFGTASLSQKIRALQPARGITQYQTQSVNGGPFI